VRTSNWRAKLDVPLHKAQEQRSTALCYAGNSNQHHFFLKPVYSLGCYFRFQPSEEGVIPSGVTLKSQTLSCFFWPKIIKNMSPFLKKNCLLKASYLLCSGKYKCSLIHFFSGELSYRVPIMRGTFQSFHINRRVSYAHGTNQPFNRHPFYQLYRKEGLSVKRQNHISIHDMCSTCIFK